MTDNDLFDEGELYQPRSGVSIREGRCCAKSWSAGSVNSHQCGNPVKVIRKVRRPATFFVQEGPIVERGYCGIHDPLKVKIKRDKRDAEQAKKAAEREAAWDYEDAMAAFEEAAISALEQIAAGHNDARGLAMEVLKRRPADVS